MLNHFCTLRYTFCTLRYTVVGYSYITTILIYYLGHGLIRATAIANSGPGLTSLDILTLIDDERRTDYAFPFVSLTGAMQAAGIKSTYWRARARLLQYGRRRTGCRVTSRSGCALRMCLKEVVDSVIISERNSRRRHNIVTL